MTHNKNLMQICSHTIDCSLVACMYHYLDTMQSIVNLYFVTYNIDASNLMFPAILGETYGCHRNLSSFQEWYLLVVVEHLATLDAMTMLY